MLSTIVIATDGSEAAHRMIACLGGLRGVGSRKAVLTHVFNVREVGGLYESLKAGMAPHLEQERAYLAGAGFDVRIEMPLGIQFYEINRVAEQSDASLIVVGSFGESLISEMLLGSTAHAVLQHAERPVLLIRIAITEGGEPRRALSRRLRQSVRAHPLPHRLLRLGRPGVPLPRTHRARGGTGDLLAARTGLHEARPALVAPARGIQPHRRRPTRTHAPAAPRARRIQGLDRGGLRETEGGHPRSGSCRRSHTHRDGQPRSRHPAGGGIRQRCPSPRASGAVAHSVRARGPLMHRDAAGLENEPSTDARLFPSAARPGHRPARSSEVRVSRSWRPWCPQYKSLEMGRLCPMCRIGP